jgi:hypothetical protein
MEEEVVHLATDHIIKVLSQYDRSTEPLSEARLADALREAIRHEPPCTHEERQAAAAELSAFSFTPDYSGEGTDWGTYYGPMMTAQRENGSPFEWPSVQDLDGDTISYWKRRVAESHHPLLRTRYADLVWDLSKSVTGTAASVDYARAAIESAIEAVAMGAFELQTDAIKRLARALDTAISIGDSEGIARVRDAMIQLEELISEDDHLGLWGFCFDHLIESKKTLVADEQRSKIIGDLEARLTRVSRSSDTGLPNPHAVESAAMRLVRYYRRLDDAPAVRRVLRIYRDAYLATAKNAAALIAHAWLKNVYEVLIQYGLTEDATEMEPVLRNYGKQSIAEMKAVSTEVKISRDELERFLEALTEGPLRDSLARIAEHFLLSPDETKDKVLAMAKAAPLQAFIPQTMCDSDGRPIATVGSVESDLEGRVVLQMSDNMVISSQFLHMTLQALRSHGGFGVDSFMEVLGECPLFRMERLPLLKRGLQAYFEGDDPVAAHLLIPQIEAAARDLLALAGGQTYRPGRMGGLSLKTLDAILREPAIEKVLSNRGSAYLRVLLTDPRGWNLRNSVMHGFLAADQYLPIISDLLVHVLMLLSLVRKEEPSPDKKRGSAPSA